MFLNDKEIWIIAIKGAIIYLIAAVVLSLVAGPMSGSALFTIGVMVGILVGVLTVLWAQELSRKRKTIKRSNAAP